MNPGQLFHFVLLAFGFGPSLAHLLVDFLDVLPEDEVLTTKR